MWPLWEELAFFFSERDLDTSGAHSLHVRGCMCVECVMDVWSEPYTQHVWDLCRVCLHSMSFQGGYFMLSF